MKKVLYHFLSLSFLLWADLEKYNVGTWNLQGSSAASESKWSVSIRQLITGDNPLDVLMVQEAGVLPNSAMMTGRMVQPGAHGFTEVHLEFRLKFASKFCLYLLFSY